MSQDQERILSRLLNKLTAVRATLKSDERDMLDAMVLNARFAPRDEVSQHQMKPRVAPKVAPRVDPAVDPAVSAGAVAPKEGADPDEVSQHQMKPRVAPRVDPAVKAAVASAAEPFKITLDEESESYRLAN